ncbi:Rpn family recombination-promoting nuclease/putative transposase [Ruegeria atlantica]|uniref:Rpn family recombination-promoting nuclease/putative transposase n=1 Tax=Ruegeria atlantica TaxID=81569 RepID=UPI00147BF93D|nr:Rpn family recombination-promoting nuclease/putative transposase [Ruegeria atlantica]
MAKSDVPTPHDVLFRALLSDPDRAAAFLRDHLPNAIAGRLAATPPKLMDGTFVDEALRSSQSDLLFEVRLTSGAPAYLYVLAEHKSVPDPAAPLQLAGYMLRIWTRYAQGRASRLRALPPIIPMVCYHGERRWTVPGGLADMIAPADPEMIFLPGERYILRDLGALSVEDLSRDAALKAGFITLRREALALLEAVISGLGDDVTLQKQVFEYILRTYPDLDLDALQAELRKTRHSTLETLVGTIAETLIAEGKQAGIAEGEARGEARGKRESLHRLLVRRFGDLPQDVSIRLQNASAADLDRWTDRVLDASSVAAVFRDTP